ncbi:MAG: CBS domain-containing protein [Candidatus Aenigmatarchaeota archaeon]
MHVHEIMTKDVISASLDTPIAAILSLMKKHRIHQIPVLSAPDKRHKAGEIAGIVVLNDIVRREFDVTKATAKAVLQSTARLLPDDTLDRAAELIIGSNQRAIPVWDGSEMVGILSEEDLMRVISVDGLAKDVAKPCISVEQNSGIGKVKELMLHRNISRVAVSASGKPGTIIGIVGTLDLIRALAPGSRCPHSGGGMAPVGKASAEVRAQRDRGYMEPLQLDKTAVTNFIHQAPMIDGSRPINEAITLLQSNEEVLVKLDGDSVGIITPKDVLRAFVSGRSVALVQIVGLDREDPLLDVARIQQKATQIVRHLSKSAELQPMKIYIKRHKKQGLKTKYSVKAELPTSLGTFIANREHGKDDKSFGQLTTIVQRALDDLEREIRKAQEKFRKPDQMDLSLARAAKEEGIGLRERKIRKRG